MKRLLISCGTALLLTACSSGLDIKVDASSDTALKDSLAKIAKTAGPEEMAALEEALKVLSVTDVSIGYEGGILGALEKLKGSSTAQLREGFAAQAGGKSGRAILAAARERKKEQASKDLVFLDAELAKLKKLSGEREAAKATLEKIEVQLPRFGYQPTPTGKMAMLEFKVANNTDSKLTSLFLRGSAIDPGSAKVLFADDINYKFPAGLLPGEVKDIRLPYSQPDKWNAPELAAKSEIGLGVEVMNAETAPGIKLIPHFTHKEADRLALLERQKPLLLAMVQAK